MRVRMSFACALALGVSVALLVGTSTALAAQGPMGVVRPPNWPAIPGAAATPMTYHGGLIMKTSKVYAIFWTPATLQSGGAAKYAKGFTALTKQYLRDIGGSGWYNVGTQYYQDVGTTRTFIQNTAHLGGTYTDTTPYPSGECSDAYTGTDCLLNSDIRSAVTRAIQANGWTPGPNKQFLVFTARDEGSCFNATENSCAFTEYCGYHSWYTLNGVRVIFTNMPYEVNTNYTCAVSGQPSPNSNKPADYSINVVSHEVMESVTDPGLDAWYDGSTSGEVGDKCAWNFGPANLDGGLANETMNGHFYYTQMEFSNDGATCVQTYP
jgi:hypothetical protein